MIGADPMPSRHLVERQTILRSFDKSGQPFPLRGRQGFEWRAIRLQEIPSMSHADLEPGSHLCERLAFLRSLNKSVQPFLAIVDELFQGRMFKLWV